ncbi:MAG: choice-of-anchor D domain-containing protein [Verrucomicrobiia bacterium]
MKGNHVPFRSSVFTASFGLLLSLALQSATDLQAAESIHPETVVPESRYSDAPNWELGTVFRPSAPGKVTHVRVFSLFEELGEHQVRVWRNADETLLAGPIPWTFGGEEGWITLDIDDVTVQAGTDYTVSVSVGEDGWYPANPAFFAEAGNNGSRLAYSQGAGVFSATAGNRPTTVFNNTSYLRDIIFEADLSGPILRLTGQNVEITDGDSTPSAGDDTQFAGANVGTGTVEHTFTIGNTGSAALNLTGNPRVVIGGPNASDFSVAAQPNSPVAAGATTTFTIRFQPTEPGLRDALVILTNDASAGAPFQFAIQGVGLGSGNLVLGSQSEGNAVATVSDNVIAGNAHLALRNMRLTELHVKLIGFEGRLQAAVYSDTGGQAGNLLRATEEATNPATGWQRLALTQPLNVQAGTVYWLAIWTDTGQTRVYANTSRGTAMSGNYEYGEWPDPVSLTGAAGNLTYSIYSEGAPTDAAGPEMVVKGKDVPIPDDSINTSPENGTDLGATSVKEGFRETTFTIENAGNAELSLTGDPKVALANGALGGFTVVNQPAATVAAGGSTTFTVRFDPSAAELSPATVTIPNSANATKPFRFVVSGRGLGGGAGVLGSDSEGTAARNIDDGQIHGTRFQAPVDMRITELRAKVLALEGTFKCAVYSDANGWADRLLRSSVDVAFATNGWNTFALTSPLEVKGGDYYWLTIWSDTAGARVQLDPVGTSYWGGYNFFELGGQWPDPIFLIESSQFLDPALRTYCIYAEGTPLSTAPGPEMDLRSAGGKLIVTPDTTPSLIDGTDFGSLDVASGTADRTFSIENRGDAALAITLPVTVTGPDAGDFIITAPPPASIAPGGSGSFTVRFDPTVRGLRAAVVSIANNDPDESPYEFSVQGAGFATGRESIWPDTKTAREWVENTPYELGMIFRSAVPGKITHLRVYAGAREAGDHIGRIWRNADDAMIGGPYTWNYSGVSGWITFDIPDVEIEADTDYTVSLSTGNQVRNYANIAADLSTEGNNGRNLSWPENAGVFSTTLGQRPTSSFNGGNYLRDIIFVPAGVVVDLPDMDVRSNGTSIADGDQSPATADGTDFGQAAAGGGAVERTFTIFNAGTAPLHLAGSPMVQISGAGAANFTVVAQPAAGAIVPGASTTFTVRFAPTTEGAHVALVSIPNDSDENPYDFGIAGAGTAPAAQVEIVAIDLDRATGRVTLRWVGSGPQFQVERAAAVTGPYQAVGSPTAERTFTDPDAIPAGAQTFYRFYRIRQL